MRVKINNFLFKIFLYYYMNNNIENENESIIDQIINQSNNEIELTTINKELVITTQPINDKFELNQDNKQRINVIFQFIFELYRVITSSLLILFVPQMCADHICTISENLVWMSNMYNLTLIFNFMSMCSLFIMYLIEIEREHRLIKFLDVSLELPNDNDNVGKKLNELSVVNCNKIYFIDKYYQLSLYVASFIYFLNIIFSAFIVNRFYAGSQSASTFITNVLFMAMKLNSVYTITSTEKNIFYSAYMKTNIQFNDIDPNYKLIN